MNQFVSLAAFCLGVFAPVAGAYNYPLKFTPHPGHRGLVVAGYQFTGSGVVAAHPDRGFVNTPGIRYTWLTPNQSTVAQQMAYTLVVELQSDGDSPVNITAVQSSALLGAAAVKSTTCSGQIAVGATCSVTITDDPTALANPAGPVYDTLRVDVTSDAGGSADFVRNFTIVLPM